jgi:hypothetical protein
MAPAFCFACVLVLARADPAQSGEPVSDSEAAPRAPVVSLEAVADGEGVELTKHVAVVLIVTNKSATSLDGVKISIPSASFEPDPPDTDLALPNIRAFETIYRSIDLQPIGKPQAAYGTHKVPVVIKYTWAAPNRPEMTSSQATTVTLQVLRRFQQEGGALPGGTAVFLYLILPIVPAFFAFDAVDRLRKGEQLGLPTFGTEHILPAFLLSLLLSIFTVTVSSFSTEFNVELAYSNPLLFVGYVAASAAIGALVPGGRWIWDAVENGKWRFRPGESPADYLRKALLGPGAPKAFDWVEGIVGSETYKGMQLQQPGRKPRALVLGARMQVTRGKINGKEIDDELWEQLKSQVFDGKNALTDRRRLLAMVQDGWLKAGPLQLVARGDENVPGLALTEELSGFKPTRHTAKTLVEPIQ